MTQSNEGRCLLRNTEIAFVAAIPFPLLRELALQGHTPSQVLDLLCKESSAMGFLDGVNAQRHTDCKVIMRERLKLRMDRADSCIETFDMLLLCLRSHQRPAHLNTCSPCGSKFGWLKTQTEFMADFK